ncbi:MAG: VanZ family protein [Deltaproteobacteria bacterium]|nr:VanZ family protein [Deltaproteobacteria bacterium]
MKKKKLVAWAPLALYMALIFIVSINPMPDEIPDESGIDKIYHAVAYAIMGFLMAKAIESGARSRSPSNVIIITILITFGFGAFIEVCQSFTPSRYADIYDAIANGFGGFLGALIYEKRHKKILKMV